MTAGTLAIASTAPIIPKDTQLLYSYKTDCAMVAKLNASTESSTSTPLQKVYEPQECVNGARDAYVSVFKGAKGDVQYVSIPAAKYDEIGKKGGYEKNPTHTELVSALTLGTEIAEAACAVGNTSSGSTVSASSVTYAHNNNGTTIATTVNQNDETITVTGITFNGSAETQILRQDAGGGRPAELWAHLTPDVTTANVVVTLSSADLFETGTVSFTGAGAVNNALGTETASGGTLYSLNITSASGNCIVTTLTTGNRTISNGASQTEWYSINPLDQRGNGTTKLATGASETVSGTISSAAASAFIGANVAAAATAGPVYEDDEWMIILQ